jgi:two-component system sensor histidine kinase EvgS
MVSGKNLLLRLLKTAVAIVSLAISISIALPGIGQGIAQKQQDQQDGDSELTIPSAPDFAGRRRGDLNSRKVRVGLYENKPKVFTSEIGIPAGIFIGILEGIAQREKWDLTYVPCEWSECIAALEEGRLDLMPDVAFSSDRDRKLDFNEEKVIESWSQVYANGKKTVENWSDLNGLRLALLKGSIQQTVLKQMISGFGYEISFVEADSYEEAFDLAARGAADVVVSNHLFGSFYCQEYGLIKTSIVFDPVSLYFATAAGANPDLLVAIDDNLRTSKSEPGSFYYKELACWLEKLPPKGIVPRYIFWIMGGIGSFLVLAFIVILLLRRQVRIKTSNLVRINESLHESEEKFRSLFQNHLAVKFIIDPVSGNIVEANEAAEKFYGWPVEQLRRMRIQDINVLSPEKVEGEMEKAKTRQRTHFEFRHRLADGSVRDVEVFSSRIDIKGKAMLHSIIHDITEHRKLEEQYRQAQKMESVGRLAGGVAHDYNNMLSVILGYTEMALEKVDPSGPLHADLTEILKAAERSTEITRQLLAFARKQTISPKVLDVNKVMESMLKMLKRLIGEDIDLVWRPESLLWPVKIDPSQLEQILANLCVNARDAIRGVGRIVIETHMVTFDEAYCGEHPDFAPGEFVLLSVSDDGSGIDKATLDSIFEPFFTTKALHQGTGLGLATVYGIVKQNNGFIQVSSELGKGTTFRIYLPRHVGAAGRIKAEETVTEIPICRGETVLLVEDEAAIRRMGRMMLERLGYKVLTAGTPDEALRLAGELPAEIHLLITDVVMPGMTGRDLADRLHALNPNIKVLFMSGYPANVIAHRGVLDEGVHLIQKPFPMKDLGIKVREILDET